MIPGANVLNMAFRLIAKQTVLYYRYAGRVLNNVGQEVTSYDAPVQKQGSWQPVPQRLYKIYGLDFQKKYFTFYTPNEITNVSRDVSGDQIAYNGQRYQCVDNVDWFSLDGWDATLCVLIDSPDAEDLVFGFNEIPLINSNQNFGRGGFGSEG